MGIVKSKSKKSDEANMKEGKPEGSLGMAYNIQKMNKKKKFAKGGMVPAGSKEDGNPGTPAAKPDDKRVPPKEYMSVNATEGSAPARKPDDHRLPMDEYMANHFAMGGSVQDMDPEQAKHIAKHITDKYGPMMPSGTENTNEPGVPGMKKDDRRLPESEYMAGHFAEGGEVDKHLSIAESILRKKKYAKGGEVLDLDQEPLVDSDDHYDQQNVEAAEDPLYDLDQLSEQPRNSNLKGDKREEDSENTLSMISKIRAKLRKGA